MLTLATGSVCDVCAEEYGPQCQPHSIPCGHVLCASCATTIAEKTPARLKPVCPFCREEFVAEDIRIIRTDFVTSGWTTPRRHAPSMEHSKSESAADVWTRKTDKLAFVDAGGYRSRDEARKLEDKVAKVAFKKSSVEEVSNLHQELEDWMIAAKAGDQVPSLFLSAALLRAILMNHVAHSEATKHARQTEASLKSRIDDTEISLGKVEAELRRQREQYSQKCQECQSLRADLGRLKGTSSASTPVPRSYTSPASPPPAPSTPTPASTYSPSNQSPLSRYGSTHGRSASVSATTASRPVTPATPLRSHTPSIRSQTPSTRSQTPLARSHTTAPPVPSLPRSGIPQPQLRFPSSGPTSLRAQTPAPPIPTKPRRLSQPSPPKMVRSLSDEKQEIHQRWLPPKIVDDSDHIVFAKQKFTHASRQARSPTPSG
ncbi:hypothetical protein BDZ89DRAFT_1040659 [Hymenopellis radicata]|nr:hypothetical protein BDZ89DRAFT_1040659 [Hymenopellis radicata]